MTPEDEEKTEPPYKVATIEIAGSGFRVWCGGHEIGFFFDSKLAVEVKTAIDWTVSRKIREAVAKAVAEAQAEQKEKDAKIAEQTGWGPGYAAAAGEAIAAAIRAQDKEAKP